MLPKQSPVSQLFLTAIFQNKPMRFPKYGLLDSLFFITNANFISKSSSVSRIVFNSFFWYLVGLVFFFKQCFWNCRSQHAQNWLYNLSENWKARNEQTHLHMMSYVTVVVWSHNFWQQATFLPIMFHKPKKEKKERKNLKYLCHCRKCEYAQNMACNFDWYPFSVLKGKIWIEIYQVRKPSNYEVWSLTFGWVGVEPARSA